MQNEMEALKTQRREEDLAKQIADARYGEDPKLQETVNKAIAKAMAEMQRK